jgi:hypothetical protein
LNKVPECATGLVFHEYLYGGTPPEGVTVAEPSSPPLHEAGVLECVDVSVVGSLITVESTTVHPPGKVTVTVYVPGRNPVMVSVYLGGTVFHAYCMEFTTLDTLAKAIPLLSPLQRTSIESAFTVGKVGWPIMALATTEQLVESTTVTV